MGVVTFDYTAWTTRYPEMAVVPEAAAQLYFNETALYISNKIGPVPSADILAILLNMLTAHIAALNDMTILNGNSPAVKPPGRLASSTEGSVSVSFQNDYKPGVAQWYQQTTYGSAYWAATAPIRTFRYRPGCGLFLPATAFDGAWLYWNNV